MQKMTLMPTQLGSTSILGNHKLQDCDMSEGYDQDDTCSSYKPSLETTIGRNSVGNCQLLSHCSHCLHCTHTLLYC